MRCAVTMNEKVAGEVGETVEKLMGNLGEV
jgi:hypothetical protein